MISPSRVHHQQQQHKQPTRDISDSHSHVRLQKGRKPLEKKSFYLDIKNHALAASLEARIKDLGGVTELFLVKSVTLVVSDRADKLGLNNCDKRKWGYGSGGSGGPPSLRSVEVPTPIATPPTPFGGEYPLSSNSTNIRGQTAQRTKSRADAMLERALTQPQQCSVDPLNNAQSWGIPIWATKKLQAWLEKIYESLRDTGNLKRGADQSSNEKTLKVKHLKNSYIKFETFKRDTRPVFLELPLWPKLNFDGDPGSCPFDTRIREKKVCKEESASLNKEKGKDMTRRPRATATRARRTEQLVAGHCEICRVDYRDLSKHVQSDKHLAFVRNDDNFLSLDKLINSGASVEAFLRANEVGQDCSIFPDGDRSPRSVELEEDKAKKGSKSDLSTFGVEEIKMVQCNGSRRGSMLNLKLSSPHNLRTRAKHESGHLLRSKGSPWHESLHEKSEKLYDKLEGFTIKKRSKGTIWIEEDEDQQQQRPMSNKCPRLEDLKEMEKLRVSEEKTRLLPGESVFLCKIAEPHDEILPKVESVEERVLPKLERSDFAIALDAEGDNSRIVNIPRLEKETRGCDESGLKNGAVNGESLPGNAESMSDECKNDFNGFERVKPPESFPECELPGNSIGVDSAPVKIAEKARESMANGPGDEKKVEPVESAEKESKDEKPKPIGRLGKRSARGFRGRPRLSVEERLIEDNRAYYKVEVLGNKLRSSTGPWSTSAPTNSTASTNPQPENEGNAQAESTKRESNEPSSEKPVVVRFKRVRRSELSLLSDEAESFMFGEPKREDGASSGASDEEDDEDDGQSSVLPRETESEIDEAANLSNDRGIISSPSINSSSPVKREPPAPPQQQQQQEQVEDESQDSVFMGRARKRRRTQAEMLLEDNEEYYTFETPGSRLRFQGQPGNSPREHPQHGRKVAQRPVDVSLEKSAPIGERSVTIGEKSAPIGEKSAPIGETSAPMGENSSAIGEKPVEETVEKLYPSKPSPEVEKMQFSFEAVPRSEPWYQTYQRQDEGAEFWHYFSEADERKPFLLPYEIENFHETLSKLFQKSGNGGSGSSNGESARKKSRRGPNGLGRSPRKSPRCHASTLAIMSTIIRKREQLQQPSNLSIVEEEPTGRCSSDSRNNTPKPEAAAVGKASPSVRESSKANDTDGELRDIAKCIDEMLSADGMLDPDDSFEAGLAQQAEEEIVIADAPSLPKGPPPDLLELLDNCHDYFNCLENSSCASSECGEGVAESPLKRRKRRKNRTGWPGIKMRKKMQSKAIVEALAGREVVKKNEEEDREELGEKLRRNAAESSTAEPVAVAEPTEEKLRLEDSEAIAETRGAVGNAGKREEGKDPVGKSCEGIEGEFSQRETKGKKDIVDFSPPVQCETITGSEETAIGSVNKDDEVLGRKKSCEENNSPANDENLESSRQQQQQNARCNSRKRPRNRDSSSEAIDSRLEIENESLFVKNSGSAIISRRNYPLAGKKRQQQTRDSAASESHETEENAETTVSSCPKDSASIIKRKDARTRKRQRRTTLRSSELEFEDQNCKNPTSIIGKSGKQQKRRNNEAIASESLDSEGECPGIAERVSPSLMMPTTELQNRRSSIEFQPVVRMMKIEDQVDMDHSILAVTVASNRRLRSSSSPRSNTQPPAKRFKRSKGPFGRWIKNS